MSLLAQDGRLARRVGAMTFVVMAALSAGFVFLMDQAGIRSPIQFRVMFRHSAGLHERAPLVVGGQTIGRIAAISPVLHGAPGALGGEVGVAVAVEVNGRDAWKVPAAATIFVTSRGPLADRYLEVAPPSGDPGPAIRDGAELRGVDPPTLDNVLQHTWDNLMTFRAFVDAVGPELTALRKELEQLQAHWQAVAGDVRAQAGPDAIGQLIDAIRGLVAAATRTRDTALGGEPGIARLVATVREGQRAIAQARAALDVLGPELRALMANLTGIRDHVSASDPLGRTEHAIDALRAALDKIDPLLAAARDLGERIARGEGTIGRLTSDPEFPEDTKALGKYLKRHPWKLLEKPPK
jgi:ABC-type transporter Mla subunit MlaD